MRELSKHAIGAAHDLLGDESDAEIIQKHIDAAVTEAVAPLVAAIDEKHFRQNRAEKAEREIAEMRQFIVALRLKHDLDVDQEVWEALGITP